MKKIFFALIIVAALCSCETLAQQRSGVNEYSSGITYDVNDLVSLDGVIYKAVNASTGSTPPSADWAQITGAAGGAETDPVYTADYYLIRRFDEDVVLGESVVLGDILKPGSTDGKWVKASALDADAGKTRYVFAAQAGAANDTIRTYNSTANKGNNTLSYGDPVYLGDNGRATTTLPSGTPVQIGVVEFDWVGYWTDTDKYYNIDFDRNYGGAGSVTETDPVHVAWLSAPSLSADLDLGSSNIVSTNGSYNYIDFDNVYTRELIAYDAGGYNFASIGVQQSGTNALLWSYQPGETWFEFESKGYHTNLIGDFRLSRSTAQIDAGDSQGLVNRQYVADKVAAAGGVTDHTQLTSIGTNTHAQIDSHMADASVHYSQGSISITESQISDLSHTVDTDTQLSQAQVGAYAEAEGFWKQGNTNIQTDTIHIQGTGSPDLFVQSPSSYPSIMLESTNWDQHLGRFYLGPFGEFRITSSFYNAAGNSPSNITLVPGSYPQLIAMEADAGSSGGVRARYYTQEITASAYTLLDDNFAFRNSDEAKVIFANNAAAQTITLPADNDVLDGWNVTVIQKGAGKVTISPNVGDTLNIPAGFNAATSGQFAAVTVIFQGGQFYIMGSLEAQ